MTAATALNLHTDTAPEAGPPLGVRDDQAARLRAIVETFRREPAAPTPAAPAPARRPGRPPASPTPPAVLPRLVAVASGKGGVGKTNTCVNLCIALAAMGLRPVLVDADLGMANADVLCGLAPARRLEQALGGPETPRRALADLAIEAPGGFRLVPGSVGIASVADLDGLGRARLLAALADLERHADVVVVDCAAGMGASVLAMARVAGLALVVATPDPTSITDAYALIKTIAAPGRRRRVGLVVNEARGEREARSVHARVAGVCARFLALDLPLLGWVAHDVRVRDAVRRRRPLLIDAPGCPASRDLRTLAGAVADAIDAAPRKRNNGRARRGLSARFAAWLGGEA